MDRIPPQNMEAEQCVLGSIMLDNSKITDVKELLDSSDFHKPIHREIFNTMIALANEKIDSIDPITISNKLGNSVEYAYLIELQDKPPTASRAVQYARIVQEKSKLRKVIDGCRDAIDKAYESDAADEAVATIEKTITKVSNKSIANVKTFKQLLEDQILIYEKRARNKGKIPGISTGFVDLDVRIKGLQKTNLYYIAARPAMGKTALLDDVTIHVSIKNQEPAIIFSAEMSKEQLMDRYISSFSMIDSQRLMIGNIDDSDWQKIADMTCCSDSPLLVDDTPGIGISELYARATRARNKYGKLGMIGIDYLQLLRCKSENRQQEIAEMSRTLKIMAKDLDCPVVCLSQLSRACEGRTDKRPMLSDLRESGSIEQDADVVMFLYRDEYYNPNTDKKNIAEIIIGKNRHGPTGTVELAWLGQYTKFHNLDRFRK